MKRTVALPPDLAPWFTLKKGTGVVHCKKCPSVFLGQQATDLALALHVSVHCGYRNAAGQVGGGAVGEEAK